VREFVIYTLMRLALLVATFAVVAGVWALATGGFSAKDVWASLLIAFVVSGIASYFLLNGQRVAFASRVEKRADAAMERMRTKEDVD
jgi:multisubunit Na+/H+ antiporter MnhE subunit